MPLQDEPETCRFVGNAGARPWVCRNRSALAAALLVFLAAAAGTWVIAPDAGSPPRWLRECMAGGRRRRFGIERQVEILEQRLRPVVDSALGHLCPVAHQVHR